uniref:Uncharacterized protein n=1 Tax=mine drainage metagenome TaxID=410659 RepID=E6QWP7_9ZZZZ
MLFDLDGPLLVDGTTTARQGVAAMIDALHKLGIVVGAVSSSGSVGDRCGRSGLAIDGVYEAPRCGKKGSGDYVKAFCKDNGFEPHNCLTVWDDVYGFREGINGPTLAFHAEWGGGRSAYGIRLEKPVELLQYLDVFFLKEALWFAKLDGTDGAGRSVTVRGLIDGNGAGSEAIRRAVFKTLKERQDVRVNGVSMPMFLLTHMLTSAYLDGLLTSGRDQVLWQIYPGHSPASTPPPLIQASFQHMNLFRSKASVKGRYGLNRMIDAKQSHTERIADNRQAVKFINQMNSVALIPGTNVRGKRVYVIDDFTTEGYSLEAARQFFYAAGARSVHLFSFGKYGSRYHVEVPSDGVAVSPYNLTTYREADFHEAQKHMQLDTHALDEFVASLERLKDTTIRTKLLESSPVGD